MLKPVAFYALVTLSKFLSITIPGHMDVVRPSWGARSASEGGQWQLGTKADAQSTRDQAGDESGLESKM